MNTTTTEDRRPFVEFAEKYADGDVLRKLAQLVLLRTVSYFSSLLEPRRACGWR